MTDEAYHVLLVCRTDKTHVSMELPAEAIASWEIPGAFLEDHRGHSLVLNVTAPIAPTPRALPAKWERVLEGLDLGGEEKERMRLRLLEALESKGGVAVTPDVLGKLAVAIWKMGDKMGATNEPECSVCSKRESGHTDGQADACFDKAVGDARTRLGANRWGRRMAGPD